MDHTLDHRKMTGFALSFGTGAAFESLFTPTAAVYDETREIPNHVSVGKYSELWINLATLFRNMVASCGNSQEAIAVTSVDYVFSLLSEIEIIEGLFQNEGNGLCQPVFYWCDYEKIGKKINSKIALRIPNTTAAKLYRIKQDETLGLLYKRTDKIRKIDSELNPKSRTNAMLLSHYAWDLLSFSKFSSLDLLESNTGKLKPRNLWWTKFYGVPGSDMSLLPMCRKLLLIFGDHSLVCPFDIRLRREILEIAKYKKWTSLSTNARVAMDLQMYIKEPYVAQFLSSL